MINLSKNNLHQRETSTRSHCKEEYYVLSLSPTPKSYHSLQAQKRYMAPKVKQHNYKHNKLDFQSTYL